MPPVESNPDVVEWRVTVVGGGKTLVESKQRFDERLVKMQALLEEYEIAAIETGNPIMYTVPEQLPQYEKPEGYTFQRVLAFRQKDLEKLDSLLDEFSDLDSEYLHVRYTLEKEKK